MFQCSSLHLYLGGGERRSQLCSDEHDWFSQELMLNTQGRWCTNIPGGFNYSKGLVVNNCPPFGITLTTFARRLIQSVCDRTFSASVQHNHSLRFKTWSLPNLFHHPSHINYNKLRLKSIYKKFHPTYKTYNLVHCKCVIAMILDLIRMVTGKIWYSHISSSRVTGCGGPRLVR